ncbi:hypothetical protein, partial [Desulfosarcina sp.]|uniref:hypothetical protein n=1 Tax=Desulfosarcina sp. TaxID=2027861 RepID=UPI003970683F
MKKRMLIITAIAALLLLPLTPAFAIDIFRTPTEMIQWDPDRAFNGYTIFSPFGNDAILVDMEGNLINLWQNGDVNTNYA